MLLWRRFGILLVATTGWGQVGPAFEVSSIKPSGPQSVRGSQGGPGSSDPSFYRFGQATLLDLIVFAYDVERFQISSAAPLDRERFDVAVTIPDGTTKHQFRAMMQNLLAERFHLKLHTQREFPAYELVVAKSGFKLKEGVGNSPASATSVKDGWPDLPPDQPGMTSRYSFSNGVEVVRLKAQRQPLSALGRMLRPAEDLPIVDKTGLTGLYDFTLEYTTGLPNGPGEGPLALDLSTALQKQLGLQLIRKKAVFEALIIDKVDRAPTPN